jgi:adenylate cyclase
MNISPQRKDDIIKVVNITIAFILIEWFLTLYNDGFVNTEYSKGPTALYDLQLNLLINSIAGLLAGIIGGSALVYVNHHYFRKKSYGYALKATFIAYSIVYIGIAVSMAFLTSRINLGSGLTLVEYYEGATIFLFSRMALVFYTFWGIVSLFIVFFLQISDKFGPGMLGKFLAGKYHQPKEEQRIFMFMDMKSSTTIAEKIGSKKYFNLLNDLFNDITDSILSTEGEIYQYVGDEVVISWSLDKGTKGANCIRCFEKVKEQLTNLGPYYEGKYGIIPTFKAGVHHGFVTAGEVGSIKRDIAYSGDVLNTTSRIQEQCNHYNVDFLVSRETLDLLGDELSYDPTHLGNIELRGKKNIIDLNTLKSI